MNSAVTEADHKARLRKAIEEKVFVPSGTQRMLLPGGIASEKSWLFDFRAVFLDPPVLRDIAHIFWNRFKDAPVIQVGGMETAAIPLVTALVYAGTYEFNRPDVTGFFVRKSRKKDGLMRSVEGTLRKGVPVVLVDDLTNTGASLMKQVDILATLGYTVTNVWTILRFRDERSYVRLTEKGIMMESLFCLDDFTARLGVQNIKDEPSRSLQLYEVLWKFACPHPHYEHVLPKSDPVVDERNVYVGSDVGTMWALDQLDGSASWSFTTGPHATKGIFSSPAIARGMVIFGGYDGNVYALDAKTGRRVWVSPVGDFIGSSPAVAEDLGSVFIGLEFGLWRKRGGIAALDMMTGERKWSYEKMPNYTHSTPFYIREHQQVVVGSNDGAAYLFDARSGALVWKFESGTPSETELDSGFSKHDIKESFAYDAKRDVIVFGNLNGYLFAVDRKTGEAVNIFEAEYGFFSTPVFYRDSVLISSLDKNLYCVDMDTFEEKWRWYSGARMFATPAIIDDSVYIGSNTGRLSELDPTTGRERGFLQLTERIVNKVAYNPATKRFFVPTQANEIYCAQKRPGDA